VDNLATFSTKNRTTYNGVEFTANARGAKYLLFGGVTTDRRASTSCDGDNVFNGNTARDNPNSARFCDSVPPFRTTFKGSASSSFPHDVQVSGSFSAIPGPGVNANYTVTGVIAGRPIIGSVSQTATNGSTVVNLVEPGTLYLDRQNRLDLRLGKTFR